MKKIVKPLVFTAILLFLLQVSHSQLHLPVGNGIGSDIKKVIREYPHHFAKLQGDIIEENPQATDYACNFSFSGAEYATITRYSSRKEPVYSWQALMLTTESFEEARAKFKQLFHQFNNMAVKMDYGVTFYLKGKYQAPVEEKNFTSAILSFEKADQITHKMKLEVSMQYEMLEWKVRVLIYERDREDTDQGEELD